MKQWKQFRNFEPSRSNGNDRSIASPPLNLAAQQQCGVLRVACAEAEVEKP
jgi:hypothetical protein